MHQTNFAGQATSVRPQTFTSISNKIVPENIPDTYLCSKTEKKTSNQTQTHVIWHSVRLWIVIQ